MAATEMDINGGHLKGLGDAKLASEMIQWEAVEFESLKDVHSVAKRLASQLDRLDVVSFL